MHIDTKKKSSRNKHETTNENLQNLHPYLFELLMYFKISHLDLLA